VPEGSDAPVDETVLILRAEQHTFVLGGVQSEPILSALRGFSAPVHLRSDAPPSDRYVLLGSDRDLFNRWEAGQGLAADLIKARVRGEADTDGEARLAKALSQALGDQEADLAFKALLITLPSEPDLAMSMLPADPTAIHLAREGLRASLDRPDLPRGPADALADLVAGARASLAPVSASQSVSQALPGDAFGAGGIPAYDFSGAALAGPVALASAVVAVSVLVSACRVYELGRGAISAPPVARHHDDARRQGRAAAAYYTRATALLE
jgi:hypothetical protein